MPRRLFVSMLAAATVVVAGCGSSSTPSSADSTPGGATNLTAEQVQADGPPDAAPTVTFGTPSVATDLSNRDTIVGDGTEVTALDEPITFHYIGVGAQTGKTFDSSWTRGEPLTYPLSGLIPGWQQAIPGMKEGGRRVLVIPGDLAYGPNPDPRSGIQPDETLVFVIDLLKVG